MRHAERRTEKRLRYSWPIWFAEDFDHELTQGQMVDLSSHGAAFTCYADQCPWTGHEITARFSVPRQGPNNSFDMENIIRNAHICRVEEVSPYVRRIAVQFAEPLPFKPGEEDNPTNVEEPAHRATYTPVMA
ncbi:MAG: PilZ domain-containing protein [Sedimentisphaerales bacterium]|nr:PilZ domain-containing protein [Sedimentisphaerales bacterium]